MSPFLKTTGHSFERRAFEFHSCEIKKLAENYLNSYFNILQPGVTWLGLQWNTH